MCGKAGSDKITQLPPIPGHSNSLSLQVNNFMFYILKLFWIRF